MRSLVSAYDAYLRRLAQQDARKRIPAFQGVIAPWGFGLLTAAIGSRVLGQPLLAVLALPFFVGSCWALASFIKHAAEFDRTPAYAPGLETPHGQELVRALNRVTLSSLSGVTLQTKLRADLQLTDRDRFELAKILAAPGQLDALDGKLRQDAVVTVGDLLEAVATQPLSESPASAEDPGWPQADLSKVRNGSEAG